jgi:hypothetical protein
MKEVVVYNRNKSGFAIIVFAILFCLCFYDYIAQYGITFVDEFFVLFLLVSWVYKGYKNREFVYFCCIASFFLIYSLFQGTNIVPAIFSDFFIEIKPFLAFYAISLLKIRLTHIEKKKVQKLCIVLSLFLLPFGLDYLAGGKLLFIFCGHPSRYASIYQLLGLTFLTFSNRTKADYRITALIMMGALLSGRSKAYGFYVFFIMMLLFKNDIINKRLFTFKNTIIYVIVIGLIVYVAWDKIFFFFIEGADNSDGMYARPALYLASFKILQEYPLLGSGFGSFASFPSGVYYSPLYYKYGLNTVYGLIPDDCSFVSDTYYPVLAQFGIVGIFLFIMFWRKRICMAIIYLKKKNDSDSLFLIISIFIMLAIESIADSTLTQNRGVFSMILLGIVFSDGQMPCCRNTRKSKEL